MQHPILDRINHTECKAILIALLEEEFINKDQLEDIVYFQYDGEEGEINMLDLIGDIHILPDGDDSVFLSFRLDAFPYNISRLIEILIYAGISYRIGQGWMITESNEIKIEEDLTDEDWDIILEWTRLKDKK